MAASRKVNRLERAGVKVSGTEYDPRKPAKVIKTYSAARLDKYISELNAFIDRKNQFAAGQGGTPLPAADVRAYRQAERRHNAVADKRFGAVANTIVDSEGNTAADRRAMTQTNFKRPQVNQTGSPFVPINRNMRGVVDAKALRQLTQKVKTASTPEFYAESARVGRERVNAMLGERGRQALGARIDKLSDKAFHVLWSLTRFSEWTAQRYIAVRDTMTTNNPRMMQELIDDTYSSEGDDFVKWAEEIDKEKAPKRRRRL